MVVLPLHYIHVYVTHICVASLPSQGGSRDDAAYRCYRKHSGEEALIKRKQKQRRLAVSQDYFINREGRQLNNKAHIHYLMKLHHQFGVNIQPQCQNPSCEHHCMPFASRCSRRIPNCYNLYNMHYTNSSTPRRVIIVQE